MNKKKALIEAKEYLWPSAMANIYDCSDSFHEADKLEARFNALMDDSISIDEFVTANLREEYIKAVIEAIEEVGDPSNIEELDDNMNNPPGSLIIPYEEMRDQIIKHFKLDKINDKRD